MCGGIRGAPFESSQGWGQVQSDFPISVTSLSTRPSAPKKVSFTLGYIFRKCLLSAPESSDMVLTVRDKAARGLVCSGLSFGILSPDSRWMDAAEEAGHPAQV